MKAKKIALDNLIKKGYKLEMPYFWYLENMTLESLLEIEKIA